MTIAHSFEIANKRVEVTQARQGLISAAVLQEKYYQTHGEFATDIADLDPNTSALSDKKGSLPKVKTSDDAQRYLLLGTSASDQSSIKGSPGKIETVCFGKELCDNNTWKITGEEATRRAENLQPNPHNTTELVKDFENTDNKTLSKEDCSLESLSEKDQGVYSIDMNCL